MYSGALQHDDGKTVWQAHRRAHRRVHGPWVAHGPLPVVSVLMLLFALTCWATVVAAGLDALIARSVTSDH